jgi:hypothetical protein
VATTLAVSRVASASAASVVVADAGLPPTVVGLANMALAHSTLGVAGLPLAAAWDDMATTDNMSTAAVVADPIKATHRRSRKPGRHHRRLPSAVVPPPPPVRSRYP